MTYQGKVNTASIKQTHVSQNCSEVPKELSQLKNSTLTQTDTVYFQKSYNKFHHQALKLLTFRNKGGVNPFKSCFLQLFPTDQLPATAADKTLGKLGLRSEPIRHL